MDEITLQEEKKIEYVHVNVPNFARLSDFLTSAIGNRSLAQFAEDCKKTDANRKFKDGSKDLKVSAATLWRIKAGSKPADSEGDSDKGNKKRPISLELIDAILLNDQSNSLSYGMLMRANGYEKKAHREKDIEELSENALNKMDKETDDRNSVSNTILNKMNDDDHHSILVSRYDNRTWRKNSRFMLAESRGQVYEMTNDPVFSYWNFILFENRYTERIEKNKDLDKDSFEEILKSARQSCIRSFMFENATLFLKDIWEPETLWDIKTSLVFWDKGAFNIIREMLELKKYHSWISLILVDPQEDKVLEEVWLPREDGANPPSLML